MQKLSADSPNEHVRQFSTYSYLRMLDADPLEAHWILNFSVVC